MTILSALPTRFAGLMLLTLAAAPAHAASCGADIAALEGRVREATGEAIASSTGGKGVAAAREGQGIEGGAGDKPRLPEAPPEKSAQAGKGGDKAQQARVALEEARAAHKKGDEKACTEALGRVRKELDAAP